MRSTNHRAVRLLPSLVAGVFVLVAPHSADTSPPVHSELPGCMGFERAIEAEFRWSWGRDWSAAGLEMELEDLLRVIFYIEALPAHLCGVEPHVNRAHAALMIQAAEAWLAAECPGTDPASCAEWSVFKRSTAANAASRSEALALASGQSEVEWLPDVSTLLAAARRIRLHADNPSDPLPEGAAAGFIDVCTSWRCSAIGPRQSFPAANEWVVVEAGTAVTSTTGIELPPALDRWRGRLLRQEGDAVVLLTGSEVDDPLHCVSGPWFSGGFEVEVRVPADSLVNTLSARVELEGARGSGFAMEGTPFVEGHLEMGDLSVQPPTGTFPTSTRYTLGPTGRTLSGPDADPRPKVVPNPCGAVPEELTPQPPLLGLIGATTSSSGGTLTFELPAGATLRWRDGSDAGVSEADRQVPLRRLSGHEPTCLSEYLCFDDDLAPQEYRWQVPPRFKHRPPRTQP